MFSWVSSKGRNAAQFFARELWSADLAAMSYPRRALFRLVQFVALLAHHFRQDQILLRASALTFTTLLSLVPLVGVLFALLKGFGLHTRLLPRILSYLTAGSTELSRVLEGLAANVQTYIDQTDVTALGFVSLLVIIASVGGLMQAAEQSFNAIWHVHRDRPFFVKLRDYTFMLIITPVIFFMGLVIQRGFSDAGLRPLLIVRESFEALLASYDHLNASAVYWLSSLDTLAAFGFSTLQLLPLLLIWLLFSLIYVYAPYTRVPISSAMAGGLVGALLWSGAYWGYIQFQVGMVRYNRIYGTLASLPFSLLWLYISWTILLVGAQVSYVLNSLESYRQLRRIHSPSPACRERLAARLMAVVGMSFQEGKPATLETLAESNATPEPLADDLLTQLEKAGLLLRFQQIDEGSDRFIPARPLDRITLHEVVEAVRHDGEEFDLARNGIASIPGVEAWLGAREELLSNGLRGLTLADIVRED